MDKAVRSVRSNKLVVALIFAVLALVVFDGAFIAWIGVVNAENTYCQPIDGYQLITSRMAQDSAGSPIYILRGIYATGEGSPGGKAITLPPCGSDDSGVEVINNVYLSLDGKQIFLVAGAIGRDALPLPEKPQP